MKSPKSDVQLIPIVTNNDVYLDMCPKTRGVWLDQGELHFLGFKSPALKALELSGLAGFIPTEFECPRCTPFKLKSAQFPGSTVHCDFCENCEGMWFDAGELKKVIGTSLDVKKPKRKYDNRKVERLSKGKLPSLAAASLFTISTMLGLLVFVLIFCAELGVISTPVAIAIPMVFILLGFIIGPWITDLSLRWLGSMRWVDISELPLSMQKLVKNVCQKEGFKIPRIGIIEDSAPNAFTYGRTPWDARVVLTRGIFELLDDDEANAVMAHELGHVVHWDFVIMTMAQMIPIILYSLYKGLKSAAESKGGSKKGNAKSQLVVAAIVTYVIYLISEFLTLYLSRIREYWADRFSGEVTRNPNALASALIKIAYGLNAQKPSGDESKGDYLAKRKGVQKMGISSIEGSQSVAFFASQDATSEGRGSKGFRLDKEAMKWDLWNPWAFFYEVQSTHPLTAKRILALSRQAKSMGKSPQIEFDLNQPESYWDEFSVDVVFNFLPFVVPFIIFLIFGFSGLSLDFQNLSYSSFSSQLQGLELLGVLAIAHGVFYLIKINFSYRGRNFVTTSVATLLRLVKVSRIRGIPVKLKGKVIGRGVPGYLLSEDFVLRDKTGIMFLDYRQPIAIFELLFAVFRSSKYIDQDVEITGWYRRAPMPFVEVYEVKAAHGSTKSWVYTYKRFWGIISIIVGAALILT